MDKLQYVIVFESAHYAIMAEKKLKKFLIKTIPTPREVAASCGISILFNEQDRDAIIAEIKSWGDYEGMMKLFVIDKETKSVKQIEVK